MKKLFTFALAAATFVGFSACSNDEENVKANMGYIDLNVSTDQILTTRADADASTYYALISNGSDYVYGTAGNYKLIGTELATTGFAVSNAQGTLSYEVAVANFAKETDWATANNGYGAAYYIGSATSNVTLTPGSTTPVDISCGKAQNARFEIAAGGFAGTALKVTITDPRTLTFDKAATPSTISKVAYFTAGQTITYDVDYTINGKTKKLEGKSLQLGGAGTNNVLTIKSDQNGYISISITYDDTYATGGSTKTIDINSADGSSTES